GGGGGAGGRPGGGVAADADARRQLVGLVHRQAADRAAGAAATGARAEPGTADADGLGGLDLHDRLVAGPARGPDPDDVASGLPWPYDGPGVRLHDDAQLR